MDIIDNKILHARAKVALLNKYTDKFLKDQKTGARTFKMVEALAHDLILYETNRSLFDEKNKKGVILRN